MSYYLQVNLQKQIFSVRKRKQQLFPDNLQMIWKVVAFCHVCDFILQKVFVSQIRRALEG